MDNPLRRISLIAFVALLSCGAFAQGTFYADYVSGAEVNAGTKVSPWKYFPGMTGSTHSRTAGDVYVGRGGITWPIDTIGKGVCVTGGVTYSYDVTYFSTATGTVDVAANGTTVTWKTGPRPPYQIPNNGWAGASITINGNSYTVGAIVDPDTFTVTGAVTGAPLSGVAFSIAQFTRPSLDANYSTSLATYTCGTTSGAGNVMTLDGTATANGWDVRRYQNAYTFKVANDAVSSLDVRQSVNAATATVTVNAAAKTITRASGTWTVTTNAVTFFGFSNATNNTTFSVSSGNGTATLTVTDPASRLVNETKSTGTVTYIPVSYAAFSVSSTVSVDSVAHTITRSCIQSSCSFSGVGQWVAFTGFANAANNGHSFQVLSRTNNTGNTVLTVNDPSGFLVTESGATVQLQSVFPYYVVAFGAPALVKTGGTTPLTSMSGMDVHGWTLPSYTTYTNASNVYSASLNTCDSPSQVGMGIGNNATVTTSIVDNTENANAAGSPATWGMGIGMAGASSSAQIWMRYATSITSPSGSFGRFTQGNFDYIAYPDSFQSVTGNCNSTVVPTHPNGIYINGSQEIDHNYFGQHVNSGAGIVFPHPAGLAGVTVTQKIHDNVLDLGASCGGSNSVFFFESQGIGSPNCDPATGTICKVYVYNNTVATSGSGCPPPLELHKQGTTGTYDTLDIRNNNFFTNTAVTSELSCGSWNAGTHTCPSGLSAVTNLTYAALTMNAGDVSLLAGSNLRQTYNQATSGTCTLGNTGGCYNAANYFIPVGPLAAGALNGVNLQASLPNNTDFTGTAWPYVGSWDTGASLFLQAANPANVTIFCAGNGTGTSSLGDASINMNCNNSTPTCIAGTISGNGCLVGKPNGTPVTVSAAGTGGSTISSVVGSGCNAVPCSFATGTVDTSVTITFALPITTSLSASSLLLNVGQAEVLTFSCTNGTIVTITDDSGITYYDTSVYANGWNPVIQHTGTALSGTITTHPTSPLTTFAYVCGVVGSSTQSTSIVTVVGFSQGALSGASQ